jgi:hypothetical protein
VNQTHDSSQTYWIIHWFLGPRTLISPIITKSDLLDHLLDHLFYITPYFWAGFPISEVPKCGHPLQLCFWMACSLSSLAKPGSQNAGMKRLPIAIPSIPSPHHSGGGSTVIFFNGVSLSKHYVFLHVRVSFWVFGLPVASPCLWGKLQNVSFAKVSNF